MDQTLIDTLKAESQKTVRRPTAKVVVTWAGRSVDNAIVTVTPQPPNRGSRAQQTARGLGNQRRWAFCATGSSVSVAKLKDGIHPMPVDGIGDEGAGGYLVGWRGRNLSDGDGYFQSETALTVTFAPQTLAGFRLQGYMWQGEAYAEWPVDFEVEAFRSNRQAYPDGIGVISVEGNADVHYRGAFKSQLTYAASITFKINRWSHALAFVKITAAFDDFTREHDSGDILSMSILEEAEGSVGTLPIGNISCNELDLSLQNIDDSYFPGNTLSPLAGAARHNRRIEPHIGFIDSDGNEHFAPKGVFWSRDWNLPDQGTGASTSALDRLGLLQDVEYNGIGNVNDLEAVAEASNWSNKNLYDVAVLILTDLRDTYMGELEFDIDESLKNIIPPVAFFGRQSYFSVIRAIAQAAVAYAFMDTPTEDEIAVAHLRGNITCADILRIKPLYQFTEDGAAVAAERMTQRDYITKTVSVRRENTVNIVIVPFKAYQLKEGLPVKVEGEDTAVTVWDDVSILEYGRIEHKYPANPLIQTEQMAAHIANRVLNAFSGAPRSAEIQSFGDVTRRVGEVVEVPEYQKHGVDSRSNYAITRLQTEYDGSLRQAIIGRWVGDAEEYEVFYFEGAISAIPTNYVITPARRTVRWAVIDPQVEEVALDGVDVAFSGEIEVFVDRNMIFTLHAFKENRKYRGTLKLNIYKLEGIDISAWVHGTLGPSRPAPIIPVPPTGVVTETTVVKAVGIILGSVTGALGARRAGPIIPIPPDGVVTEEDVVDAVGIIIESVSGTLGTRRAQPIIPVPPDGVMVEGDAVDAVGIIIESISGSLGASRPAPIIPIPPDGVMTDGFVPVAGIIIETISGSLGPRS